MPGGAITYGQQDSESSAVWLKRISRRFPRVCWLNPVPREIWEYGQFYTLQRIRKYFHMEDMTLGGIKRMVEFLGEH